MSTQKGTCLFGKPLFHSAKFSFRTGNNPPFPVVFSEKPKGGFPMFRKASRFLAAATCAALLLPCAAPAALPAVAESSEADTIPYSLIVCGTLISDCIPYHSDGQYALIPVVPMLEGLGISLDWLDDHTARFEVSGEDLVLDTAAGTLVYADSPNFSLLLPAPGSKHPAVITTIDGVFMVDTDTLLLFFQRNSIYCYRYDADSTVEIGFREDATPSA
jgi:hypothetical protein